MDRRAGGKPQSRSRKPLISVEEEDGPASPAVILKGKRGRAALEGAKSTQAEGFQTAAKFRRSDFCMSPGGSMHRIIVAVAERSTHKSHKNRIQSSILVADGPGTTVHGSLKVPGLPRIKELVAKGEEGEVFSTAAADKVLKVSDLAPSAKALKRDHSLGGASLERTCDIKKSKWEAEVRIGRELGAAGLAPVIYDAIISGNHGYILMQRVSPAERLYRRRDDAGDPLDRPMPDAEQVGFVRLLERVTAAGYCHHDTHVGNVGWIIPAAAAADEGSGGASSGAGSTGGQATLPVVYDFGFTVRRPRMGAADRTIALAFAVCQLLEHMEPKAIVRTRFWRVVGACLHHAYVWGSADGPAFPFPATDEYRLPRTAAAATGMARGFAAAAKATAAASATVSAKGTDLLLGVRCYMVLLQLPRRQRYASAASRVLIDTIYRIRRSEQPMLSRAGARG